VRERAGTPAQFRYATSHRGRPTSHNGPIMRPFGRILPHTLAFPSHTRMASSPPHPARALATCSGRTATRRAGTEKILSPRQRPRIRGSSIKKTRSAQDNHRSARIPLPSVAPNCVRNSAPSSAPLAPRPPGAGRVALDAAAARARGSASKRKERGFPPNPPSARAIFRRTPVLRPPDGKPPAVYEKPRRALSVPTVRAHVSGGHA
jgi:hypothetical protein